MERIVGITTNDIGPPMRTQWLVLATWILLCPFAGIALAQNAESTVDSQVRIGRAAFGDWRSDAPLVRRKITVDDLPKPFATPSASHTAHVVRRPAGTLPKVPPGFQVELLASGLSDPRALAVAPNGDVFIAESEPGRIRVLRGADDERAPRKSSVFASGLEAPFGIAFFPPGPEPEWVYVANVGSVVRYPYHNGDLAPGGRPEVIVPHLAGVGGGNVKRGHITRDIVFSRDGHQLFVSVGSATNNGEGMRRRSAAAIARWEAAHGLGASWGNDADRALVLAFDPDGKNRRTFATGLRNCVGLAVHPQTGDLWCSTNERDGLGDDLVPDFITRVSDGGFFGWPWYFLGAHEDPNHRGERPELKDKIIVPDILIQAHSAPMRMTFYDASQFPVDYRGDGFVALHGSWNRSKLTGYKVVRVRLKDGIPTGEYDDFMIGFVVNDTSTFGRPVGVAVSHEGALLVSEDGNGTIWRVTHRTE